MERSEQGGDREDEFRVVENRKTVYCGSEGVAGASRLS